MVFGVGQCENPVFVRLARLGEATRTWTAAKVVRVSARQTYIGLPMPFEHLQRARWRFPKSLKVHTCPAFAAVTSCF